MALSSLTVGPSTASPGLRKAKNLDAGCCRQATCRVSCSTLRACSSQPAVPRATTGAPLRRLGYRQRAQLHRQRGVECGVLEREIEWIREEGAAAVSALAGRGGTSFGEAVDVLTSPDTWTAASRWLSISSGDSRFQLAGVLFVAVVLWGIVTFTTYLMFLTATLVRQAKNSWREARGQATSSDVPTMDLVSETLKDLRRKKDVEPLQPPKKNQWNNSWWQVKWFRAYYDDLRPMAHTENVTFELTVLAGVLVYVYFWALNDETFLIP